MNEKSLNIAVINMRQQIWERYDQLIEQDDQETASVVANEWIIQDEDGLYCNPDQIEGYQWLCFPRHKKVTDKQYKRFEDLEF